MFPLMWRLQEQEVLWATLSCCNPAAVGQQTNQTRTSPARLSRCVAQQQDEHKDKHNFPLNWSESHWSAVMERHTESCAAVSCVSVLAWVLILKQKPPVMRKYSETNAIKAWVRHRRTQKLADIMLTWFSKHTISLQTSSLCLQLCHRQTIKSGSVEVSRCFVNCRLTKIGIFHSSSSLTSSCRSDLH